MLVSRTAKEIVQQASKHQLSRDLRVLLTPCLWSGGSAQFHGRPTSGTAFPGEGKRVKHFEVRAAPLRIELANPEGDYVQAFTDAVSHGDRRLALRAFWRTRGSNRVQDLDVKLLKDFVRQLLGKKTWTTRTKDAVAEVLDLIRRRDEGYIKESNYSLAYLRLNQGRVTTKEAKELVDVVELHQPASVNVLLRSLKDPQVAVNALNRLRESVSLDGLESAFEGLLRGLVDSGSHSEAETLVKSMVGDMSKEGMPFWLNRLRIDVAGKIGRPELLYQEYSDILAKEPEHGKALMSHFIMSLACCGRVQEAEKICAEYPAFWSEPGIQGTLIQQYLANGSVGDAKRIYRKAAELDIVFSTETYAALARAFSSASHLPDFYALRRDINSRGVSYDQKLYTELVRGYMKHQNVNEARAIYNTALADHVVSKSQSSALRATFIHGLLQNNRVDEAEELLASSLRKTKNPGPVPWPRANDPVMIVLQMKVMMAKKQFEAARRLGQHALDNAAEGAADPVVLAMLINSLTHLGDVNSALKVLRKLKSDPKSRIHPKDWKRAENDCNAAPTTLSSRESPLLVAYSAMIKQLTRLSMQKEVLDLLDEAITSGLKPNLLTVYPILVMLARANEAESLLEFFKRTVTQFGITPDHDCLVTLYAFYARMYRPNYHGNLNRNQYLQPLRYLMHDVEAVLQVEPSMKAGIYDAAISYHIKFKEPWAAEHFFLNMHEIGVVPTARTLDRLLAMYETTKEVEKAAAVRMEMEALEGVTKTPLHTPGEGEGKGVGEVGTATLVSAGQWSPSEVSRVPAWFPQPRPLLAVRKKPKLRQWKIQKREAIREDSDIQRLGPAKPKE
ncbi:uncharacterized protein EV422DRAFT_387678 [Fimicolochytrium jonesii]|uniref:uncharacterized protein n=1 Tax=Fimicolochytrium jonesii TaxID=1396493 RepID=UPI0022FE985E|nr:uncharacterized protein EV422DRAFT_387678 [Fimicolochytrium jonesii]KAI8823004.1 hypothetical protein EV422DRAFT_387678 [Fimicolochytrium jonesii]